MSQEPTKGVSVDQETSDRIQLVRFVMIFGVIILHVPPYIPLPETPDGAFSFLRASLAHGLFRATVPIMTCIAGYLLFKTSLDRNIPALFVKKTQRLFVPLVLWNLPLAVLLYIVQSRNLISYDFSAQLYPFDPFTFLDKMLGLTSEPIDYPLNFVRDLFVLCLLAPLFGILLRRWPWLGLVLISVIFLSDSDGYLVRRSAMPVNFYLGGMAALLNWNPYGLDRYKIPCLTLLIGSCVAIVAFEITARLWYSILSPFLVWSVAAPFVYTGFGRMCRQLAEWSYFLYLAHAPALLAVWFVYLKLKHIVPYGLFWLTAPFITLFICMGLRWCLRQYAPVLERLASGLPPQISKATVQSPAP